MEECGVPTAATKRWCAGRTACGDPGENLAGSAASEEDGNPEYGGVRLDFLERTTLGPESTARANDERRQIAYASEKTETKERIKEGFVVEDTKIGCEPDQRVWDFFDAADEDVMDVPYVDWTTLFLLGYLRQWDSYEDELARKAIVPEFGVVRPEAIYQALRQMEKEGMIVSELDVFDRGTFRRRYAITGSGEAYLAYLADVLAQYRKEIDLFFRFYNEQIAPVGAFEASGLRGGKKGEQKGCL
jgi:DNA-binding PadR family transcriptional regulator